MPSLWMRIENMIMNNGIDDYEIMHVPTEECYLLKFVVNGKTIRGIIYEEKKGSETES